MARREEASAPDEDASAWVRFVRRTTESEQSERDAPDVWEHFLRRVPQLLDRDDSEA